MKSNVEQWLSGVVRSVVPGSAPGTPSALGATTTKVHPFSLSLSHTHTRTHTHTSTHTHTHTQRHAHTHTHTQTLSPCLSLRVGRGAVAWGGARERARHTLRARRHDHQGKLWGLLCRLRGKV